MRNILSLLQHLITRKLARSKQNSDRNCTTHSFVATDDQLFATLCQFIWIQGEPLPLVFDLDHPIYTDQGITPSTLKRLESAGLIMIEPQGFIKKGFGKHTRIFYCGRPTKIGFSENQNNALDLGHVLLTEQGKAWALTHTISRNQPFYEYVINHWFQQGLTLSSVQIEGNRQADGIIDNRLIKEQE